MSVFLPPRARNKPYFFQENELSAILSAYSNRVATGEWRDYAIDHNTSGALFSIFKHTAETPLFVIEKRKPKGIKDAPQFYLHDRKRTLAKSGKLQDVLFYLDRMPRLVQSWSNSRP